MKTGAAEAFLSNDQNLEASAGRQNCGFLPAGSRSNNNYLIVCTHRVVLPTILFEYVKAVRTNGVMTQPSEQKGEVLAESTHWETDGS
jgi:hypothetical protein